MTKLRVHQSVRQNKPVAVTANIYDDLAHYFGLDRHEPLRGKRSLERPRRPLAKLIESHNEINAPR
jgi:hypothetical protein